MTFGKHLRLETGNQVNLTSGERRGTGDRIQLPMANDLISHAYVMRRRRWHPTPVLLPGKSHGQRSLVGCSPWGHKESDTTERLHFHFSLSCIGEGNGSPLQCSCLENPGDGGAWWTAVYGVAQSQTQLKWLSSSSSLRNVCVSRSVMPLSDPWTVAHQASLPMGVSRQEYRSGFPFPSPGDLPDWLNLGLLQCRWIPSHLSHQGSH